MKGNTIEVIDTYDSEGYLVKKTANGMPMFIPKGLAPQIQIIDKDTEWVMQKSLMTKEEFKEKYPSFST